MPPKKKPLLSRRLKPRLNELPFHKFLPNLITITALCAGLSGVRFALDRKWEVAVTLVLVAMVLDGLDGRVARLLKSTSKFGAELDSLADFCNFGIVPGVIMYQFSLNQLGRFGWPIALIYTICMVLRLARFNTIIDTPQQHSNYSIGVAAPCGALLALTPMIYYFHDGAFVMPPFVYGAIVLMISGLLISRIPTFAFKKAKISRTLILPVFLSAALVVALLVAFPWASLTVGAIMYMASIPVSFYYSRQEVTL